MQASFGERLLAFNLLPSRTLHPTRHARFGAPGQPVPARLAPAWHRQWSREILAHLDLQDRPVHDVGLPELPVVLLPPDRLARLARYVGATLYAPRLRRAIEGDDVRHLAADLGADVLDFARRSAPESVVFEHDAADTSVQAKALDRLGCVTLMGAMQASGPEITLRAELKLPDGQNGDPPDEAAACLALALDVLKLIEPTWHSSFLVMR